MADQDPTQDLASQAALAAMQQQSAQPLPPGQIATGQAAPQQPQVPSNRPGMPALVRLIGQMVHPAAQVPQGYDPSQGALPRPSRLDAFEGFLGNFVTSLAQGMAQSGHGPGANMRGAGAAIMAPYQQNVQNYQLQQQAAQAQAQRQQMAAQTAATQANTIGTQQKTAQEAQLFPLQKAQEQANLTLLQRRLQIMGDPETFKQGMTGIAPQGMSSDEQTQWNGALQEASMKGDFTPLTQASAEIMRNRAVNMRAGQSYYVPDAGSDTGITRVQTDKSGKVMELQKGVVAPFMMPKTTTRESVEKDVNGNLVTVPLTSTTTPRLPGATPGAAGGKGGGVGGAAVARPVLGPGGQQMHAPLSQEAKTSLQKLDSTENLLNDVAPQIEALKNRGALWDSVTQRAAWAEYTQAGIVPSNIDPVLAKMLPAVALLQVVGSTPYLQGIRRFEFVKQVQQHLPDPTKDTPELMYNKIKTLQHNLPMLRQAIYSAEGVNTNQATNEPQQDSGNSDLVNQLIKKHAK